MTVSRKLDQTNERPYKSMFKAGYVTEPDHICELIFKIRQDVFKKTYPESFWNGKYKREYIGQRIHVARLLKKYSGNCIIRAVKQVRPVSITDKKLIPVLDKMKEEQKEVVQYESLPVNTKKTTNRLEGL